MAVGVTQEGVVAVTPDRDVIILSPRDASVIVRVSQLPAYSATKIVRHTHTQPTGEEAARWKRKHEGVTQSRIQPTSDGALHTEGG